jgi:hypothetical protein
MQRDLEQKPMKVKRGITTRTTPRAIMPNSEV